MANHTIYADEKNDRFFDLVARGVPIGQAAFQVGYTRESIYHWRDTKPDFRQRMEEAQEAWVEAMEREVDRRAVEGVEKGIYYQGERVDTERVYSDNLAMFRLKALRPDRYRDNVNISSSGGPLAIVVNYVNRIEGQAIPAIEGEYKALPEGEDE